MSYLVSLFYISHFGSALSALATPMRSALPSRRKRSASFFVVMPPATRIGVNTHFLTASDMSVKKPGSAWPGLKIWQVPPERFRRSMCSLSRSLAAGACVFDGAAASFVVAASQAYGDDEVLIGFGFDASDDFEG